MTSDLLIDLDDAFTDSEVRNRYKSLMTPQRDTKSSQPMTMNSSSSSDRPLIDVDTESPTKSPTSQAHTSAYSLFLSLPDPRRNLPADIIRSMNTDTLQDDMIRSWIASGPNQSTRTYTQRFLEALSQVLNQRFGSTLEDRRYQVDVFGSVSWGGETGESGDLDLVILDRKMLLGCESFILSASPESTKYVFVS